jgi:hypothetical protein
MTYSPDNHPIIVSGGLGDILVIPNSNGIAEQHLITGRIDVIGQSGQIYPSVEVARDPHLGSSHILVSGGQSVDPMTVE